jgi:hypothetical protein
VVLTGIATSDGADSTAHSAYDLDYNVGFVVDAMTDRDSDTHRHCVEKVFLGLGETAMAVDALTLLQERPVASTRRDQPPGARLPDGRPRHSIRRHGTPRSELRTSSDRRRHVAAFGLIGQAFLTIPAMR